MAFTCDDCGTNMGGVPDYQHYANERGKEHEVRHLCKECWVKERSCPRCNAPVLHLTDHRNAYRETLRDGAIAHFHADCA